MKLWGFDHLSRWNVLWLNKTLILLTNTIQLQKQDYIKTNQQLHSRALKNRRTRTALGLRSPNSINFSTTKLGLTMRKQARKRLTSKESIWMSKSNKSKKRKTRFLKCNLFSMNKWPTLWMHTIRKEKIKSNRMASSAFKTGQIEWMKWVQETTSSKRKEVQTINNIWRYLDRLSKEINYQLKESSKEKKKNVICFEQCTKKTFKFKKRDKNWAKDWTKIWKNTPSRCRLHSRTTCRERNTRTSSTGKRRSKSGRSAWRKPPPALLPTKTMRRSD